MNLGFLRVAAVVPRVDVANCEQNAKNIITDSIKACKKGAKVVVFPELSVTAYTCGDLFGQTVLLDCAEKCLCEIKNATSALDCAVVVGAPLRAGSKLFNCAVLMSGGKFIGVVPKTYIPNYKEFYEKRWFTVSDNKTTESIKIGKNIVPFGSNLLFVQNNVKIAIEICEDLWTAIPPSSFATLNGANVILNLSASNESLGKHHYLMNLIKGQSARCMCGYVYSSAGFGESTTDLVFAGNAVVAENGTILKESKRFAIEGSMVIADIDIERLEHERRTTSSFSDCASNNTAAYTEVPIENLNLMADYDGTILRTIEKHPFVPSDNTILDERCEEIVNIQVEGLIRRLSFTGIKTAVIGISGGLDSTLALLVCHKAFEKLGYDYKDIIGITMPGFGTTDRTYSNAMSLMKELGITIKEIPIRKSVLQHFEDIGHDANIHDVTYENGQARERTQILMDYANRCGALVVGTGDLSELALGWATYNGDHMSMYGVNAGVPKTLVRYIVRWFAVNSCGEKKAVLLDIVDTPISPELVPADEEGNIKQKTEDLVGPYELHDFFLYNVLRFGYSPSKIFRLAEIAFAGEYSSTVIKKWLLVFYRRFFQQQFKRSCLPDGPKVGSISLSPRGDWRMPSDACAKSWLEECEYENRSL